MAGSNNVKTFASAQIFYSAGSQGLQILTQIFIADTSDLLNRALWSSLPDIPFLVTVWVGPEIASDLLSHTTWRWGYGVWTIVLPVSFLPLAISLILNTRKAAKLGQLPAAPWKGHTFLGGVKNLWYELDIGGLLLLSAAFSLILIPCTLAARAKGGWNNGSMIAMIVVGCVCLVCFPLWESNKRLAPRPFLPLRLMRNRTVVAGCCIGFFYFGKPSTTMTNTYFRFLTGCKLSSTLRSNLISTLIFKSSRTIRSPLQATSLKFFHLLPPSHRSPSDWLSNTRTIINIISRLALQFTC